MSDRASVRRARPDDADEIGRIHVESWRVAYRGLLPDDMLRDLDVDQRAGMWRARLEEPRELERIWVIETSGVVGFAMTTPSRDDDAKDDERELVAIYLAPSQWGRGRGEMLFRHIEDDLLETRARGMSLWVLEENARARRFYERMGMTAEPAVKKTVRGVEVSEVRYRRRF